MHDTAFRIGTLAMNIYADLRDAAVLEIGSQSVNGSLRDNVLPTTKYVGVDIEEGPGVDLVVKPGKPIHVDEESFDLVIASSVFEHDPCFWVTFLEMCKKTREGGYIYVNAPSNGVVHRFPQDNWRFYPDSGKALANWAKSQGQFVSLVESFIADRDDDIWNDFVAVFRKGRITKTLPKVFIHEHLPCTNVVTWKSKKIINPVDEPQDLLMLKEAAERARTAEEALVEATAGREALAKEGQQLSARLDDTEQQVQRICDERDALRRQLAQAETLRGDLALRESELQQRQEEIAQTRAELAQIRSELANVRDGLAASEQRLSIETMLRGEADAMAAKLQRQLKVSETEMERAKERSTKQLSDAEAQRSKAEAAARANETKLSERYEELATLANLLRQHEDKSERMLDQLTWLLAVSERMTTQPWWWSLMPKAWRRGQERRRLHSNGLFDGSVYLERYPDVAAANMDPLQHYLRHGIHEGRSHCK